MKQDISRLHKEKNSSKNSFLFDIEVLGFKIIDISMENFT